MEDMEQGEAEAANDFLTALEKRHDGAREQAPAFTPCLRRIE